MRGPLQKTINEIAAEELAAADGNIFAATEAMEARIKVDMTLYRLLMDPLVRNACYDAIRGACKRERRQIYHQPQPTEEAARGGVEGLATATRSLYYFSLPGGKHLGDASKEEVSEAANFYLKQSADMRGKGLWLRMIAKELPRNKTVRQVLSLQKLANMKEKAIQNV